MKAAVLNAFGSPLAIETLPGPVLGTGEVIVDVVAAGVAGYAANIFNGSRTMPWSSRRRQDPAVLGESGQRVRTRPCSSLAIGSFVTQRFGHATIQWIRPSRLDYLVLMGGVRSDLALSLQRAGSQRDTLRGAWMYPRDAIPRMVQMIHAGLIALTDFEVSEFRLEDANDAVAHAAANAGPRQLTVIRP